MKSIILILTIASCVFASCNERSEKVIIKTVKGQSNKNDNKKVIANAQLNLEISGMSCEKGCGGTIRKALKQTGGVERVSYDFVEGRDTQIANITLDSNKINLNKIQTIISELNENQFTTGKADWAKLK
jgi:copper chaperone CopZ